MSRRRFSSRAVQMALFLAFIALIATIMHAYAAYRVSVPIVENDGHIRQDYLYGEGAAIHKGVDYPVATGTTVHAIADGVAVQVLESIPNGCHTTPYDPRCPGQYFGNFVLVRHNQRHWDKTTGQWAYVYSIYAHLSQDSVVVAQGDPVIAGQSIAQSDDTGNSSGPHSHLQIMIDPSSTRSKAYPLSWSESESRNPELWLNPYNGNTGTVIGKVTYNNGQDYPGVLIYGSLSGHNPDGLQKNPAWDYETSLTYNNSALKSDDILVENWGTTDVTPGHYHITTSAGGDLGWHDVVAGQVTYAGLFPVWLPYVRNKNGWNSTIVVRNNSDNYRAQVNITFFNGDGTVNYQRPSDYIDAHAAGTFGVPSGFDGSAMVVSSEDIAVVVREESGNELNEYNGIMASTNISASLGWERAGSIVYAPIIKKNLGNRSSKLFIANTGSAPTTAYIQFYNSDGSLSGSTMFQFLSVFGSVSVHSDNCTDAAGLCSAKVWSSNGQPLAAAILEQTDTTTQNRSTHNAFSAGATSNFVPLIKNNAGGQTTNLAVQNLGTVTTISVVCYPYPSGTSIQCGTPTSVQPNATVIFIMSAAGLPNGFLGSAVVSSSGQPIATLLYETGTPYKLVTNAPLMGTTTAYAPELYGNFWQNNQTWDSGISIQNTSSSANATITVSYYNQTGAFAGTWSNTIGPYRTWILNYALGNLPGNFRGSAVIQSTQAMAAVVNMAHTGTGDTKASYTVPNR